MPVLRTDGPYIWVAWLNKLITGDQNCEWAYWFRTQFDSKSWTRAERVGNLARWQVGHTDLLNRKARELREAGYTVTREAHRTTSPSRGNWQPWPVSPTWWPARETLSGSSTSRPASHGPPTEYR